MIPLPRRHEFRELVFDDLRVTILPTVIALGRYGAEIASDAVASAVRQRGVANILLASANSQLTFLRAFRAQRDLPWSSVVVFHVDEYIGLSPGHASSFSSFLQRHFLEHVRVGAFYPVPGHASDVTRACRGYENLLRAYPIDL